MFISYINQFCFCSLVFDILLCLLILTSYSYLSLTLILATYKDLYTCNVILLVPTLPRYMHLFIS